MTAARMTKKELDALRASGKPLAGWKIRVSRFNRVGRVEVWAFYPRELKHGRGTRVEHVTAYQHLVETHLRDEHLRLALEAQGAVVMTDEERA
jgi:hypothetical protein